MTDRAYPDFASVDFLRQHIDSILDFYAPNVRDDAGGFFHNFRDDGSVYDPKRRHLVSATRWVFNFANASQQTGKAQYGEWAQHAFDHLQSEFRQPGGHYVWQINGNTIEDGRAMAYGHAFVMLAAAWAARIGIDDARPLIREIWDFLEEYFFEPEYMAYADERDSTLAHLHTYRGQNANMHIVEALIAAFETTHDQRYLIRAEAVARQFCSVLAQQDTHGQVWEHYYRDWQADWQYNIGKPDDLFKPWGFQPGHQVEWAKLLLQLDVHTTDEWHLSQARHLFDSALRYGWDTRYGGVVYGYAPDGEFADDQKYFWVQAEAIAAAWRLYRRTGDQRYQDDYLRLWRFSWDHLIDHQYGAWYRVVKANGDWIDECKSPMGKVDYHTMGACWDILNIG